MATKYKIAVNSNGAPVQANNNQQIIQQLAQNAVNQTQATQPKEPDMRETVNELLKNKLMQEISVPQFTTIQDIVAAPKGSKLETFGKYLGNNPDITRLIGTLAGGTYMDRYGRFINEGNEAANRQEAQMQAAQKRAIDELKEQNDIATELNKAFNQRDIADENNKRMRELAEIQLEWQKQKHADDLALAKQQLGATIAHQRAMEGIARERLNATNKQEKQLQKNLETLNSLNAIQGQLDRFSDSFKDVRGSKLGALLADKYASAGFGNTAEANFNAQRTLLFNKIARELGGEKGVLSDQDIKRIETSLPALSDSLTQKKAKMQAIYNLLDDRKQQYGGAVGSMMTTKTNDDGWAF